MFHGWHCCSDARAGQQWAHHRPQHPHGGDGEGRAGAESGFGVASGLFGRDFGPARLGDSPFEADEPHLGSNQAGTERPGRGTDRLGSPPGQPGRGTERLGSSSDQPGRGMDHPFPGINGPFRGMSESFQGTSGPFPGINDPVRGMRESVPGINGPV